jgi:hypothetical protein
VSTRQRVSPGDADTIAQALDLVAFRHDVLHGVRRLAGSKSLQDVLGHGAAVRSDLKGR